MAVGFLLLAAGRLAAQTTGVAAAPAPAPAPADEPPVMLNPFAVTATQDYGYRTSNSISGTRTNTPIKDIPINIQVFTSDVISDLSENDQVDIERYNAAMVNGGQDQDSDNNIQQAYNNFLFRGFVENWSLRDGIREYDPVDLQGIARIEIVKGPVAPLYGLTYPGGVQNLVTKDVDFGQEFAVTKLTAQSYGEYRATVDANAFGKLDGGLFGVRFNGAYEQSEDQRSHSVGHVQFDQTVLDYQPTPTTEIKFLSESGDRWKPNGLGYFSTGDNLDDGADVPLQATHPNIPWTWNWSMGSMNKRSLQTSLYRGTVTQSIGDNLTVTGYWQYSERHQVDSDGWDAADNGDGGGSAASWDMGSGTLGAPVTGWLNPNTPQEKIQFAYHFRDWNNTMHAYGGQAEYKLDFDALKNTFVVGGASWEEFFMSHKAIQPGNTTNYLDLPVAANINISAQTIPFGPPNDYYQDVLSGSHELNKNYYYFANWQGSALDDKLHLNFAVNYTSIDLTGWDTNNGIGVAPNITKESKYSPMEGAVYEVVPGVSLFAVHSTSLFPTTDKNSFMVEMPPVVGASYEGGVKVDLYKDKISGTISYYDTDQNGGSQTDPNANNLKTQEWDADSAAQRLTQFPGITNRSQLLGDLVPGGKQESKGLETDLIFQPTPSWQALVSYAHNDERVVTAINQSTIGEATPQHIADQLSVLGKYSVTEGTLKGGFVGMGIQWQAKQLQNYFTDVITNATVARYNPAATNVEAFVGYRFKAFGHKQEIQVNAKNLSREPFYVGWKSTGSNTVVATQRWAVSEPIIWSVSYVFEF
jgi:outer membrane receptor protein involved in Fe transport